MGDLKLKRQTMDELAAKIVAEFAPGELISHDYMMGLFNLKYPQIVGYKSTDTFLTDYQTTQFKYMTAIDKLRDELLDKEMYYLRNIRGDGYVLLPPKDQVQFAFDRCLDQVKKEFRIAKDIVLHIRTDAIPVEQQSKNHDLIAKLSNLQQIFSKERK